MAWIKVDQTLFDHEKTFALGEKLEMPELYAVIHVIAFWMHAIDHWEDGKLPENDRLLARAGRWDGPATVFAEALVSSGFVDEDIHGYRTIHNWEKYSGELIRKRQANAKRMREARNKREAK